MDISQPIGGAAHGGSMPVMKAWGRSSRGEGNGQDLAALDAFGAGAPCMTKKNPKPELVSTKFYLMKEGLERADMLIKSSVKGDPADFQGLGEAYAGVIVPSMFETTFTHGMRMDQDVKAKLIKHANAALFIELDGRVFGFRFGKGKNLINKRAVERRFGIKVAMHAIRPSWGGPDPAMASRSENVNRFLYDGGTRGLWDITHTNYDCKTGIVRSVAGYTRPECKSVFSSWIRGSHGVSIYARKDLADVHGYLRLAMELKERMDPVVLDEHALLTQARQEGWDVIKRERQVPRLPKPTELMAYTIRAMIGLDRPVRPVELYGPVARAYGYPVMEPTYYGQKRHRWNLKRLVRFNLEEAVELGLVNQDVKAGCYTVTPLGREVSKENEQFTNDLLNRLCARQMRLHGTMNKPGRLSSTKVNMAQ